jgi:invasin D
MTDLNVMSSTVFCPMVHSERPVSADVAQASFGSDALDGSSQRSRQFASFATRLQGRAVAAQAIPPMHPETAPVGAESAIAQTRVQADDNAVWLRQLHGRMEGRAADTVLQRMALLEAQSFAAHAGVQQQGASPPQGRSAPPPESAEVEALQGRMERQVQALAEQPVSSDEAAARASGDFFDNLQGLIDLIGSDYLEVYEHLIKQYSDMFSDFNKEVMAKMSEWIKGVNDGKEVEFEAKKFVSALTALLDRYQTVPAGVAYPVASEYGELPVVSKEDAAAWAKAMGLKPEQVQWTGYGWVVMIDTAPLKNMWQSMMGQGDKIRWDSAKFQAWQTGFNTQEAEMKNYLQVATSKYSNANAYHDNFIKIMSSQLSQFAEMLKAYLT